MGNICHWSLAAATLLLATATHADVGPCLPDTSGGLTCGQGAGAARVIAGTISPSKRLAIAWRSPKRPPTEDPSGDDLESLLIRLSDGAVLGKERGEYWATSDMRVNRYDLDAMWSPNSRFVVESTDFRWSTEFLRLYSIGADDKVLAIDLKAVIEPAVRKRLRRLVKNEASYAFAVFGRSNNEAPHLTVDNRGLIKTRVQMGIPKEDALIVFDVSFQITERDGAINAREVSIQRSRAERK